MASRTAYTAYLDYLPRFGGDVENALRFHRLFRHREVFVEREVNLQGSDMYVIQTFLEGLGWSRLLQTPDSAAVDMVREFYCAIPEFLPKDVYEVRFVVRGRDIVFSDTLIAYALELPRVPEVDYNAINPPRVTIIEELCISMIPWDRDYFLRSNLKPLYRALNQVVNANIQPKRETNRIYYDQAKLLFVIGRRIEFDFPKFMFDNIRITTKVPNIGLPYGSLITRILLSLKISLYKTR